MKPTGKLAELARIQQQGGDKVVLPLVEQHLLSRWGDKGDRKSEVLHVSEIAKKDWCERASYQRIKGGEWPEEQFSFTLQSIFDEGHQIHDKWQTWLAETGQLWGDWQCLVCGVLVRYKQREELDEIGGCLFGRVSHIWKYQEVSLAHGLIQGREDGAIGDRLIEFKSVGLGTLRREAKELLAKSYKELATGGTIYDLEAIWKGLRQPLISHVRQANMYMWLAQQMAESHPIEYAHYAQFTKASIVYEFKPNQQSREYVIPLSMDIVQPMLDRVNVVQWALDAGIPPPCRYGGCTQCEGNKDEHEPGERRRGGESAAQQVEPRVLVHRASSGPADRGDPPAAGAVRGSQRRVHRGRRDEAG